MQGIRSPVPASDRGEQAGPGTSSSCVRKATGVAHLAPLAQHAPSDEFRRDGDPDTLLSPFERSGKIQRTPPSTPVQEICTELNASVAAGGSKASGDVPGTLADKAVGEEEQIWKLCINIIKKMKAATGRQRNISMDIKTGLAELEEAVDALQHMRNTQLQSRAMHMMAAQEAAKQTPLVSGSKRAAISPAEHKSSKKGKKGEPPNSWMVAQSKKNRRQAQMTEGAEAAKKKESSEIAQATKKVRKKKPRLPKSRSDALLIKPIGGKTYAEVLGEIRRKTNPEENDTEIRAVRRTRSGDVLLELGAGTKNKEGFCRALKGVLGESATIRSLEPMTTLEIRDLDSFTTDVEVQEAIKRDLKDLAGELKVAVTRANSREQKLAIVQMNERGALELLKNSRIKIGWVNCRVRQRVLVTRCYACFGFGHRQADCKGPDRKKEGVCIQCGEKGHIKKECSADPKCFLCAEGGLAPELRKHVPGSGGCHVFRQALDKARKSRSL